MGFRGGIPEAVAALATCAVRVSEYSPGSFPNRESRDLTRRRTELVVARGQEAQRLEKELEDAGMKLSSVLTDVTGLSSRRILEALIAGERDPQTLAELSVRTARQKIPALVEALDGTFTDHHGFMCRHYLDQIDHLDAVVSALDARIGGLLNDHDPDLDNLDSIPSPGSAAAPRRSSSRRPVLTWRRSPVRPTWRRGSASAQG